MGDEKDATFWNTDDSDSDGVHRSQILDRRFVLWGILAEHTIPDSGKFSNMNYTVSIESTL